MPPWYLGWVRVKRPSAAFCCVELYNSKDIPRWGIQHRILDRTASRPRSMTEPTMHEPTRNAYVVHEPHVIQGVSDEDVEFVIRNLRNVDRAEALCHGFNPAVAAPALVSRAVDPHTAYYKGLPAFIFGTYEVIPGVRELFGFGTPNTIRVMPVVTWFTDDYWLDEMFDASGVRRVQAVIPATHVASLAWLEGFGMYRECSMAGYSVNGVPMLQLAFTRREYIINVLGKKLSSARTRGATDEPAREDECGHPGGSGDRAQEAPVLH